MSALQVVARHTILPGHEDEVLGLVRELVAAARTEPGNLEFNAYRSVEEARSYVLLERYVSRGAFGDHRATQHFQDLLLGRIVPLLESRTIEQYDVTE